MDRRKVNELCASEAVREANERRLHTFSKVVEHEEQVERMIAPVGVVAEIGGVESVACALVANIGDPDGGDGRAGYEL